MKREIIRVEPLSTYLERSLILKITVSRLGDAGASLGPHLDNELSSHLGYINDKLEGQNYLLGDELTAADIQLSFFGELASARTGIASYPNIGAWVNRFQARPPYKARPRTGRRLQLCLIVTLRPMRTLTFVNERSMPQIRDNNRHATCRQMICRGA
jgi:hypothetical protein